MMVSNPPTIKVRLNERLQQIKDVFKSKFGRTPLFYARAPGRVNLIGEHIDYCGYAVLPMAIEQSILAAVFVNDSKTIHLANTDQKYKSFDGSIPASSGLSSSSALVCCAGLLTVALAETCAKCERYIGTEGGGMDQSISFLAEEGTTLDSRGALGHVSSPGADGASQLKLQMLLPRGTFPLKHLTLQPRRGTHASDYKSKEHISSQSDILLAPAKLIEFNPLRASDVSLPGGAVFVIANCCVEMNKAASSHFNMRVVECRIATKAIDQRLQQIHDLSCSESTFIDHN
ncbi:hypothetical protein DNTS_033004 [Danionella cerebrum]|uniref:Galactokinase N-terminal domain-containing protein n=1 Tax=Danionella cerebrum TaxID=2873325 RepID=A0A553R597_9TELE|nr:hypothetical protein DNTS_033004 [Danionella translucida]